ncbi:MAG TPA: HU family DNA-binding protein [Candidatus Merdenecus merdavium]|nr:HU family DNA-binding protein [Candidatus Merdenecus merdavium]
MNKNNVTKQQMIEAIARENNIDIEIVKKVYNRFEQNVFLMLQSVTPEEPVEIRAFEGISIQGVHQSEREKKLNYNGEKATIPSRIRAIAKITRNYNKKLNNA